MANIYTTYDPNLKEKVFIVKGEEGYARTTDCVLEEILHDTSATGVDPETGRLSDWNHNINYMKIELHIDVLRDIGEGYLVLYDNDEVCGTWLMDTNTHSIDLVYNSPSDDNRLELSYDVEHNIYAKYMGNKHCLKSRSKSYSFTQPLPDVFASSIEFEGVTSSNLDSTSQTFKAVLKSDGGHSVSDDTIAVYLDGVKLDDYTTDSGGKTPSITLSDLSDGLHTISASFSGNDTLSACTGSIQFSQGAIVTILDSPKYILNDNFNDTLTLQVVDYYNNPVTDGRLILQIWDGTDEDSWISYNAQIINEDGTSEFAVEEEHIPLLSRYRGWKLGEISYYSEDYSINIYTDVYVEFDDIEDVINTQTRAITGRVYGVSEAVTIPLEILSSNSVDNVSVTTDENGYFTYNYRGTGVGEVTFSAYISSGVVDAVTIKDYYQYWKVPSTIINQDYWKNNSASLTTLSNGFKLVGQGNSYPSLSFPQDGGNTVEFKVVSVSGLSISGTSLTNISANNVLKYEFYLTEPYNYVRVTNVSKSVVLYNGRLNTNRIYISCGTLVFDELKQYNQYEV